MWLDKILSNRVPTNARIHSSPTWMLYHLLEFVSTTVVLSADFPFSHSCLRLFSCYRMPFKVAIVHIENVKDKPTALFNCLVQIIVVNTRISMLGVNSSTCSWVLTRRDSSPSFYSHCSHAFIGHLEKLYCANNWKPVAIQCLPKRSLYSKSTQAFMRNS